VIIVATTAANDRTIRWYLETYGAPMRDTVVPVHYEVLLDNADPVRATYCFADLELMTDEQRGRASVLREQLVAHGCRVLNDPARTLRRFDLLRMLHDTGVNDFTAHREDDPLEQCRFPVFIRGEHDHQGRRSGLLDDADDAHDTIGKLRAEEPNLRELLVVEFCATAGTDGVYHKYSAFKVGDAIIARHLFFSHDWQVKHPDLNDEEHLEQERAHVAANPHVELLRPLFDAAAVDYGRIDYSFLGDRVQIWEINTNPTILLPPQAKVSRGAPRPWIVRAPRRMARTVLGPLWRHTAPGRRLRTRQLAAQAERRPRAAVNHQFADRLAAAWTAVDDSASA
jgi:hypothetical protein